MIGILSITSLLALFLLSGCGSDSSTPPQTKHILMDLKQHLPFPNDLYFLPTSTQPADGTLNIPFENNDSSAMMMRSLDRLDGFSTTAPLVIPADTVVEPTSLLGRVHLYQASFRQDPHTALPIATKIERELSSKEFALVVKNHSIVIVPKVPLEGDKEYVVSIDKGVVDMQGEGVGADRVSKLLYNDTPLFGQNGEPLVNLDIQTLKKIEILRPYFHNLLRVTGKRAQDVVLVFGFKTQTIGKVVNALSTKTYDTNLILQDSGYSVKALVTASGMDASGLKDNAEIYTGLLRDLPYFLAKPTQSNPVAPLLSEMKTNDFDPIQRASLDIPVLATVPKSCPMPPNGWPVVIFQHGITQNRTNLLALGETFADICYAAVAVDLPLHGITNKNSPLYMPGHERTFDLDLVAQDEECHVISYGPDGIPDCSGTHYINLLNAAVSRDNMRQSSADMAALIQSLGRSAGVKFDSSKIAFAGHSLGAMAPLGYLANKKLSSSVLANPGGGIIQMLFASPTFGPEILSALSEAGIEPGSEQFDKYGLISQTLVDDADPINYAKRVADLQKVLLFEVQNDQVIPNEVPGFPLSGTEPLIRVMGAKPLPLSQAPGFVEVPKVVYTKFVVGEHSSLLRPTNPHTTREMHKQMASFIQSGGKGVLVEDLSVLE